MAIKRTLQKHPLGALFLFDFSAAFPSLNHEYMWDILKHIGVPSNFIRATKLLYQNNYHQLKLGSELFPSITLHSGVRQGCPMSPTLVVLCIDLPLDKLAKSLPQTSTLRAFAHDIGLSVHNRRESLPILAHHFHHFAKYCSLHLNLHKTLLIPYSPLTTQDTTLFSSLSWEGIDTTQTKGKYLGIYLGPSATPQDTLQEINAKFLKRIRHWEAQHLPPSYKFFIYNTFLHPLYSYFAQFYLMPEDTLKQILHFIRGPKNWIPYDLLTQLKPLYGYPYSMRHLQADNIAALICTTLRSLFGPALQRLT